MQRLLPERSALLVVDVQERLCAVMPQGQLTQLRRACRVLLESARVLGVPTLYTEQYPRGLGGTLDELRGPLEALEAPRVEKLDFSAAAGSLVLPEAARAVVVVGMEAHVCVFQTARDLLAQGLEVHVPVDGVCSRHDEHRSVGLALCGRAGAVCTTAETVVFDWLGRAGTPQFKALAPLLR